MDLAALQKLVGPLATIAGAVGAIFGFFLWWHKRVIAKLEAEAEKARAERMEAIAQKTVADTRTENAIAEKNVAVEEKAAIFKKGQEVYLRAKTAEKQRDDAVAQVKQLQASLAAIGGVSVEERQKLRQELEAQLTEKQQEIERLHQEAAILVGEKESLTGKLEEARKKLADERRTIREALKQQGKIWLAKVPRDVPRFRPLKDRRTVIIAVLNLKGGVGKTTITANLAALLGSQGKKVLMIDLDHQRSLSRMLLSDEERSKLVRERKSIQTFFTGEVKGGPQLTSNLVRVEGMAGCELIVNHDPVDDAEGEYGLEELEMQMQLSWLLDTESTGDIRFYLREGLHGDSVANSFDYVFLDCPPRMSAACVNALTAADFVLIPVQGEDVAKQSLIHLALRLGDLRSSGPCPSLRVLGVVGNLLHPATDMETSAEVVRLRDFVANLSIQNQWPEPVQTFATVLPRMKQYLDATSYLGQGGELRLAIQSRPVRTLFEQLAKEIEDRIHDHRNTE